MIPVSLQPAAVEIETLGPWRLDGQVVEPGRVVSVLPSLAADLIARGKARRFIAPAAVEPEVVAPVDAEPVDADPADAPPPAPETPPAPTPVARGKK